MRVGTRITAVTSALVASTLAMYASYDLRDRAQERRLRLESETRAQAVALRTQLELQGVGRALAQAEELSQELSEAVDGMRVWILPASAASPGAERPRGASTGAESGADGASAGAGAERPASERQSGADGTRNGGEGAGSGAGASGNGLDGSRSGGVRGADSSRTDADGTRTGAGATRGGPGGAARDGAGEQRDGADAARGAVGAGPGGAGTARAGSERGSDAARGGTDAAREGSERGRVPSDAAGAGPDVPAGAGAVGRDASGRGVASPGGAGSRGDASSRRSRGAAGSGSPGPARPDGAASTVEGAQPQGASGSAARATGGPASVRAAPGEGAPPVGPIADVGPAIERLRDLVQARPIHVSEDGEDSFAYALPLRRASRTAPDGYEVAGSIDVARSLAPLQRAWRDDLVRTLPILAVIVALVVIAVMLFTRSLVSRPIDKLLAGIDDVARGDLSRVLLSEREDEIGALAARFNEMTYSLRESRAETERQNADKTKLEERLFQTEKLATIGQLAAEIAHEVGTPLNVIVGRSRAMAKKAGDPEAVAKNAEIVAEQASRITRIIQRLLDTARRKVGAPEAGPVDLNRITATTMDFLEGKFAAARVTRTLTRAEALPAVKGDSDQLQQVLINLLMNAIEAMPRGGQIRVETSLVTRRRPGLEIAPEQPVVVVEVADTGVGIPADQRDRVFEPFYTTKEGRGGTGLGLAVSHGIIKEHDGWMEVEDAHGGPGSVFRVCLPAAGETG